MNKTIIIDELNRLQAKKLDCLAKEREHKDRLENATAKFWREYANDCLRDIRTIRWTLNNMGYRTSTDETGNYADLVELKEEHDGEIRDHF